MPKEWIHRVVLKSQEDIEASDCCAGDQVFAEVDPGLEVTWTHKDGDFVLKGTIFGTVHGSARSILVAERIALNFLQRMSGIATAAHAMATAVKVCTCFPDRAFTTSFQGILPDSCTGDPVLLWGRSALSLTLNLGTLERYRAIVVCFDETTDHIPPQNLNCRVCTLVFSPFIQIACGLVLHWLAT